MIRLLDFECTDLTANVRSRLVMVNSVKEHLLAIGHEYRVLVMLSEER